MKNETFRKLCIGLLILMGLDLILTIIGVEYMGMVEPNPLYMIMGAQIFIMFKTALLGISIVLFYLFKNKIYTLINTKINIKIFTILIIFLNVLYTFVVITNIYVMWGVLI